MRVALWRTIHSVAQRCVCFTHTPSSLQHPKHHRRGTAALARTHSISPPPPIAMALAGQSFAPAAAGSRPSPPPAPALSAHSRSRDDPQGICSCKAMEVVLAHPPYSHSREYPQGKAPRGAVQLSANARHDVPKARPPRSAADRPGNEGPTMDAQLKR